MRLITVSPGRKAIYESSMRKTDGKMNAACMFWDNNGNKTLWKEVRNPGQRNDESYIADNGAAA